MRPFPRVSGFVALVALLTIVVGWLSTPAAQQVDPSGIKIIVSDRTAPAMDAGLRAADPLRPVRTAAAPGWVSEREGGRYLPGSVIVRFKPGTSAVAQRALLAQVDGSAAPALTYADFQVVTLGSGDDPEAAARRLSAQPDVEYAQARYRVRPLVVPNDPLYSLQWNFPAIDMERAWDINPGASTEIIVAVLDTGVAFREGMLRFTARAWRREEGSPVFPALGPIDLPFAAAPDLAGPNRFVAPHDFIWDDDLPFDMDGHGTHVAGTLGQLTNNNTGGAGMAYNVRIMPVKVIDGEWDFVFNSPFIGTDDTVARGIRYAVDNGARVINMSIGRSGAPAPTVQAAIAYAVSHGAFVAVAGGNEFQSGDAPPERLAEFAPQIDGMVAVGAIGRDRLRAAYSSTGGYIELVAPGGDFSRGGAAAGILQQTLNLDLSATFEGTVAQYRAPRFDSFAYYYFTGTSMATPHVAGFAAMLMQQGITSPAAIEALMKQSATDLGPAGRDNDYGYGLINPRSALRGMGLAK
jgi:serine protease